MLPSEIKIRITAQDIEEATSAMNCPIMRAIKRTFPYLREVKVQEQFTWLSVYGKDIPWRHMGFVTPPEAKAFYELFDAGKPVKPTTLIFKFYCVQ